MDWIGIIQRLGLPLAAVLVLSFVIYRVAVKAIWPYFQSRLERADKQSDLAQQILSSQLEKVERVQDTLLKDFRGAIEENNRVSRRVADSLDELLKRK